MRSVMLYVMKACRHAKTIVKNASATCTGAYDITYINSLTRLPNALEHASAEVQSALPVKSERTFGVGEVVYAA